MTGYDDTGMWTVMPGDLSNGDWPSLDDPPEGTGDLDQVLAGADDMTEPELAALMLDYETDQAVSDVLAGLYDDPPAADLANPAGGQAIELAATTAISNALDHQVRTAAARRQEAEAGQARSSRPRTSEQRLQDALSRIGQGTYTGQELAFAAPTGQPEPEFDPRTAVTAGLPCGHVDELGRCGARYQIKAARPLPTLTPSRRCARPWPRRRLSR
jgi:hypothetical protein